MKAVSVTNTAGGTKLADAGNRDFIHIYNNGTESIFIKYDGDATDVTTVNGIPVPAGAVYFLDNDNNRNLQVHEVYAICAAGPVDVRLQGVS